MLSSCCHGNNRDFLKLVTSLLIKGYTQYRAPAYVVEFTRTHANLTIKEKPSHLALLESSSSSALRRLAIFFGFAFSSAFSPQDKQDYKKQGGSLEGEHFPIYQQHIHEHSLI